MGNSFVIKGNLCQTKTPRELDLHPQVYAVVLDDRVLPHPQSLTLAERMERAVYLGLDEKRVTAKIVAGRQIL